MDMENPQEFFMKMMQHTQQLLSGVTEILESEIKKPDVLAFRLDSLIKSTKAFNDQQMEEVLGDEFESVKAEVKEAMANNPNAIALEKQMYEMALMGMAMQASMAGWSEDEIGQFKSKFKELTGKGTDA